MWASVSSTLAEPGTKTSSACNIICLPFCAYRLWGLIRYFTPHFVNFVLIYVGTDLVCEACTGVHWTNSEVWWSTSVELVKHPWKLADKFSRYYFWYDFVFDGCSISYFVLRELRIVFVRLNRFRIESAVYTTQAVTPSNELQGAPCRRTVWAYMLTTSVVNVCVVLMCYSNVFPSYFFLSASSCFNLSYTLRCLRYRWVHKWDVVPVAGATKVFWHKLQT